MTRSASPLRPSKVTLGRVLHCTVQPYHSPQPPQPTPIPMPYPPSSSPSLCLQLCRKVFQSASWLCSTVVVCRYNKPLLPKYEAAERSVLEKQQGIEAKIAGRRINQASHPCFQMAVISSLRGTLSCVYATWVLPLHNLFARSGA